MIIRPCVPDLPASIGTLIPAWNAIEAVQRQHADSYVLVTQPDHARLSGNLAAEFISPAYPSLSQEAVQAIAAHDAGWLQFPGEGCEGAPLLTDEDKPRSFIEFEPAEFTRAWTGSIDHASSLSAFGGILVSRHFTALGESALRRFEGRAHETDTLATFLRDEELRQRALARDCSCSDPDIENGLRMLQFCDLLSLALCCDIRQPIEFPQSFGGVPVRMQYDRGAFVLSPSPFQSNAESGREISLTVQAREYPAYGTEEFSVKLR